MKYENKIERNVKKEFDKFKSQMLKQSPKAIFESAGKIFFYEEIYTYISENDLSENFSAEKLKVLYDCGENIISLLYDEYLSREYSTVSSWDGIYDLIERFLEVKLSV